MRYTGDQSHRVCTDTARSLSHMTVRRSPPGSSRMAGSCQSSLVGSETPCIGSVQWSCCSLDQILYRCHSDMDHRLEIPTTLWDTGDQSCVGSTAHSGCLHSRIYSHERSWASCDTELHFHRDSGGKRQCSFSHSNLVHIYRCGAPTGLCTGYELDKETRDRGCQHYSPSLL